MLDTIVKFAPFIFAFIMLGKGLMTLRTRRQHRARLDRMSQRREAARAERAGAGPSA